MIFMKTRIIIIFLLTYCSVFVSAQTLRKNGFLFPDFRKGEILFKNGGMNQALLNYNTIDQQMFFVQDGKALIIGQPDMIRSIMIDSLKFVPIKGDMFYQVIMTESSPIYVCRRSTLVSQGKNTAYGGKSGTTAITNVSGIYTSGMSTDLSVGNEMDAKADDLYFIWRNDEYINVSTRKQIERAFRKYKSDIEAYIQEHNPDLERDRDIVDLLKFCINKAELVK